MESKQYARDPLFYIQQPKTKTPEARMQHNYDSSRQHHQQTTQQKVEEKVMRRQTRPLRRNYFQEISVEEPDEVSSDMNPEESLKQQKFSDMTLDEKINYFVDRSDRTLQMRCEVETADKTFRGVVTGKEEGHILMLIGRRTSHHKISISDITDIRMLGLK